MTPVKACWHVCTNFGDALTPYLIKKISGQDAEFATHNSDPSLVMVTGSILSHNITCGVIWGTGCAFESDLDPSHFTGPSENFRIIATRGKLSKTMVEKSGHRPIAFGDPGILLPNFYTPNFNKKYDVGIMSSWIDYNEVCQNYQHPKLTVINSMGEVEDIINKICECEALITSTLHGLVAAVAYGIPTVSVKFSDKMIGDGFKYRDFLTCTDKQYEQIDLRKDILDIDSLMKLSGIHNLTIDTAKLLECCPFKQKSES
jgi:pyruvyltransferase